MTDYVDQATAEWTAERLASLRTWSESISIDERQVKSLIHQLFETPGEPPSIAVERLEDAIEGIENQIARFQSTVYLSWPGLPEESSAIEQHTEIVSTLRDAFEAARLKDVPAWNEASSSISDRLLSLDTESAEWVSSIGRGIKESYDKTVDTAGETVQSSARWLSMGLVGLGIFALVAVAAYAGVFTRKGK